MRKFQENGDEDSNLLPSKSDRLQVFHRIEHVVEARVQRIRRLPASRKSSLLFAQSSSNTKNRGGTSSIRKRQIDWMKLEFLPTVSAALLLELQDFDAETTATTSNGEITEVVVSDDDDDDDTDQDDDHDDNDSGAAGSNGIKNNKKESKIEQPIECIALMLSNMLLLSKGNYDARVRSILKTVCVELLVESFFTVAVVSNDNDNTKLHENTNDTPRSSRAWYFLDSTKVDDKAAAPQDADDDLEESSADVQRRMYIPPLSSAQQAVRLLESIERAVATEILKESLEKATASSKASTDSDNSEESNDEDAGAAVPKTKTRTRGRVKHVLVRSLKIGTVGVVVGAAFAFTGGLAAPGLVAAIGALGIGGTSAAFATLTTVPALASMFGVVGGGLAAYKMKKRTQGLSEWRIRKETLSTTASSTSNEEDDAVAIRGLHATVCVSGWLADSSDFQRPWGIQPNDPAIQDKLELLQRFFAVYAPEKLHFCKKLVKANKKNIGDLWSSLEKRYGRDPDHLLPFDQSSETQSLTEEMEASIDSLLKQQVLEEGHATQMERIYEANGMIAKMNYMNEEVLAANLNDDNLEAPKDLDPVDGASTLDDQTLMTVDSDRGSTQTAANKEEPHVQVDEAALLSRMETLLNDSSEQPGSSEEELTDEEKADMMAALNDVLRLLRTNEDSTGDDIQSQFRGDDSAGGRDHSFKFGAETNPGSSGEPSAHKRQDAQRISELESLAVQESIEKGNADRDTKSKSMEAPGDIPAVETAAITKTGATDSVFANKIITAKGGVANDVNGTDLDLSEVYASTSGTDESIDCNRLSHSDEKKMEDFPQGEGGGWTMPQSEKLALEKDLQTKAIEGIEDKERDVEDGHESESSNSEERKPAKREHDVVVWDWQATYGGELYTITWETPSLLQLCKVVNVLAYELTEQISKQVLQNALLAGTVAIPSAMATMLGVVDDPYQLICFRSDKAGVELALALMQSEEHRPVSLVGYSFGARVVFSCLLELARHQALWEAKKQQPVADDERKKSSRRWRSKRDNNEDDIDYTREPASIIEDVVLIGTPRLLDAKEWILCREIVNGRLVNCFNKTDWILSYMINVRCWNGLRKTCGTHAVMNIEGIENYEVSEFASTHGKYPEAVPEIMNKIGYGGIAPA